MCIRKNAFDAERDWDSLCRSILHTQHTTQTRDSLKLGFIILSLQPKTVQWNYEGSMIRVSRLLVQITYTHQWRNLRSYSTSICHCQSKEPLLSLKKKKNRLLFIVFFKWAFMNIYRFTLLQLSWQCINFSSKIDSQFFSHFSMFSIGISPRSFFCRTKNTKSRNVRINFQFSAQFRKKPSKKFT